jgi:hypothetical protein
MDEIKVDGMGRTCRIHGRYEKIMQNGKRPLGRPRLYGRMTLKLILK